MADFQATQPTTDSVDGSVTPGVAAAEAGLIAGYYNGASTPTPSSGQQVAIQVDANSRLITRYLTATTDVVKSEIQDNSGNGITSTTISSKQALDVNIAGGSISVGVADKTAFTYGTTTQQTIGGVFQDTSPTLIAGQEGALRLNGNRALHATFRDPTTDVGITSASNGNATPNQMLHVQAPDTAVASTALGALNATIQVTMAGLASVGFQILSGTFIGTLTPECSIDGGTTWIACNFYNPASESGASTYTFSSANATTVLSVLPIGGSSHTRVIVTAYTSGTANAVMRASEVTGPAINTSISLPTTASKFSFGRVTTAATSLAPVEETTYTEQITNGQRSLASSNAGDISGGTGARTVLITYYDQTGAGPFTETVTMAGTATANTVGTNICYIESLKVTSVGSAGSNQGTITLFTAINKGGTTITTIAVGDVQTFHAHHYVPLGKTCYISGFSIGSNATSAGAGGLFLLKASTPTVANSQELQVSDFVTIGGGQSTDTRTYNSPIQVVGPARVRAYVTPYATSSTVQYASFDFIDN